MPLSGTFGSNKKNRQIGDAGSITSASTKKLSQDAGTPTGGNVDIAGQILGGTTALPDVSVADDVLSNVPPITGEPVGDVASAGAPRGNSAGVTVIRPDNYVPGGDYDHVFREFTSHGPTGRTSYINPLESVENADGVMGRWNTWDNIPLISDKYNDDISGSVAAGQMAERTGANVASSNNDAAPAKTFAGQESGLNDALRDKYGYGGEFAGSGDFSAWRGTQSQLMQDDITNFINNFNNTPVQNAAPATPRPTLDQFSNQNYYNQYATDPSNPGGAVQNAARDAGPGTSQAVRQGDVLDVGFRGTERSRGEFLEGGRTGTLMREGPWLLHVGLRAQNAHPDRQNGDAV